MQRYRFLQFSFLCWRSLSLTAQRRQWSEVTMGLEPQLVQRPNDLFRSWYFRCRLMGRREYWSWILLGIVNSPLRYDWNPLMFVSFALLFQESIQRTDQGGK